MEIAPAPAPAPAPTSAHRHPPLPPARRWSPPRPGRLRRPGRHRERGERDSGTARVLLHGPAEVRAEGVRRGRPLSFARRYGTTCERDAPTGAVFAF
ncbi:hypothetical protein GCM10010363_29570 [Streptomyces omiyaensis]|uniref:hypothetical protein n=1 Tax=Streptomyces omiyaensis TaxID=68247 RepID=UPI00167BCA1B|nr:hypothetical protein [Streptomyces omiyaensis]GGY46864.1 hypothetical protein GCM10010363_29570 [Streptomyces omiyaensis]